MRSIPLLLAAALLAACSINVHHGAGDEDASCSISCRGSDARVSAHCRSDERPRCGCDPAPSATCEPRREKP